MKQKQRKKRCKWCNALFLPTYSTLQKACSPKCAMQLVEKKKQDSRDGLLKAEKEHKERKGLTTLIKSTITVFHEYVRERDKGLKCIACGTEWKNDFQASHYYKAELYSTLKFHEDNVFSGCMECNLRKEGNLSEFVLNIPKRIGEERFSQLNILAHLDKKTDHKWDRESLNEIRKYYNKKLKELES